MNEHPAAYDTRRSLTRWLIASTVANIALLVAAALLFADRCLG